MRVVVALEHRYVRAPDGSVWTQTTFPYLFWQRYLTVFDHVHVIARIYEVDAIPRGWKCADGEGVSFADIPNYLGALQYLLKAHQVKAAARKAASKKDAVIIRVASNLANCIQPMLQRNHHPYGVEVVADPYDVFAPGSIRHPLRPFFRWLFPRQLRHQCAEACAAAYVTKDALQTRYPPALEAFSTHFSDIELPDTALMSQPRCLLPEKRTFTLIFVGTLAQLYKAPDVLIKAVAVCIKDGLDLKLILIGEGAYRAELEETAIALGIGNRVYFLGQLSAGAVVQTQLDQADLFVLPSHQEGLPRAMVEAMARALPCIGSTVGGIPELLPPEDRVQPGNVQILAEKIREVVTDPDRMARMSARNLEKAQEYKDEVLQERRIKFYRYLREETEVWLDRQTA
jgi:glycosyltransferase involved in cell wall biosynthesis